MPRFSRLVLSGLLTGLLLHTPAVAQDFVTLVGTVVGADESPKGGARVEFSPGGYVANTDRNGRFAVADFELGTAADYELILRFLLRHGVSCRYIPEVLTCMRVGGMSNATLANRIKANRNDRKAWEMNGLKPYPWTVALKPLRKIPQWFRMPSDQ